MELAVPDHVELAVPVFVELAVAVRVELAVPVAVNDGVRDGYRDALTAATPNDTMSAAAPAYSATPYAMLKPTASPAVTLPKNAARPMV